MMKRMNRIAVISIIGGSLFLHLLPVYGDVLEQAVQSALSSFGDSGSTQEARINSLNMDSISNITSRLGNYTATTDVTIAISAGSTFIEGEYATTNAVNELAIKNKAQMADILVGTKKDGFQGESSFSSQESSLVDSIAILTQKLSLQQASATSFRTAAATALNLKTTESEGGEACTKPLKAAYDGCEPAKNSADQALAKLIDMLEVRGDDTLSSTEGQSKTDSKREEYKKSLKSLDEKIDKAVEDYNKSADEKESNEDYGGAAEDRQKANKCQKVKSPLEPCKKLADILKENESSGKINNGLADEFGDGSEGEDKKEDNKFDMEDEFGSSPLLKAGFSAVTANLSDETDKQMLTPVRRIALWETCAVYADKIAASTSGKIAELEENLAKVRSVKSELAKIGGGAVGIDTEKKGGGGITGGLAGAAISLAQGMLSKGGKEDDKDKKESGSSAPPAPQAANVVTQYCPDRSPAPENDSKKCMCSEKIPGSGSYRKVLCSTIIKPIP
ncbi:MAG: hypothetical protein WC635_09320 [Bacteriovorax sp.]|jgi:hypothetical protein